MSPRNISISVQEQVRQRANYLCEYCHTSEHWQYVRFTIDHIIPLTAGGTDTLDNLALACFHCNRRKSTRQNAIDPETQEQTALFNPRRDSWSNHFQWSADGLFILPQTATGRATIALLALNRERISHIRAADIEVNRHPPANDPRQPEIEQHE
jgi:hypothetical protein